MKTSIATLLLCVSFVNLPDPAIAQYPTSGSNEQTKITSWLEPIKDPLLAFIGTGILSIVSIGVYKLPQIEQNSKDIVASKRRIN